MMLSTFYAVLGMALFVLGLYRLIMVPHPLVRVIAFNVTGVGVFMLMVAGAFHPGQGTDPVPHAMVLTGIVVSLAATALALFLAIQAVSSGQPTASGSGDDE